MGSHKLLDLVDALESLARVPEEVAQEVVPEINEAIRNMGRPGGPLRGGNAVKAHVEAVGNSIRIVGVFPTAGVRRSWVAAIERVIAKTLQKKKLGG